MRSRREMSYRRVLCLLCTELGGCGLVYIRRPCGIGVGQSQGPEPSRRESSDPMIEAGAPSTWGEVVGCPVRSVPAPPGVVMVAPPEIPRNAQPGKARAAPKAMV